MTGKGCGLQRGEGAALALPCWEGSGWWAAGGLQLPFALWLAAGVVGSELTLLHGVAGNHSLCISALPRRQWRVSRFGSILIGNRNASPL